MYDKSESIAQQCVYCHGCGCVFQSRYYVFNIIAPVTLVLFITLGVFWLPPGCGEKISLGITVLLSYSVMQVVIMDITPVNSKDTPIVGQYSTEYLSSHAVSG